MKRIVLFLLVVASFCGNASAQRWIDVTSNYLVNPKFNSNDKSDWECMGEAGSLNLIRVGCMETWNGTFGIGKTITNVPSGRYRVSVNCLFRAGSHADTYRDHVRGRENLTGYFFVNDQQVLVKSNYDFGFTQKPSGNCYEAPDGLFYPNSMEAAALAFSQGEFYNEIEVEVTDGTMHIGLYNDIYSNDNWMVWDNFKIEMLTYVSDPSKESLVINEVMTGNVDNFISTAYNFDKWIEIYNPTDQSVILDECYFSDKANELKMFQMPKTGVIVPAKGYYVVWFDSHGICPTQPWFDLDNDGGAIYISDKNGQLLTSYTYPSSVGRSSFARQEDGGEIWGWTVEATPGKSNVGSKFASVRLQAPTVNVESQMCTSAFDLQVDIPTGCTLRYTTDGSTPTDVIGMTSTDGAFRVSRTSNYRFRLYREGYLPSPVTTRSFIFDTNKYTVPVISVVTKHEYLYDDVIGCAVKGTNGRTGNGQSTPANWNMDWDRPVSFQYIMPDGTCAIDQEVSYTTSGGWTRANEPKSFKLKASKKYEGQNTYEHRFWEAKPFIKSKTIQVRGGGNDGDGRIKDALIQSIIQRSGIDIDMCSYQPAVVFINGNKKGVMNVREPNNKHHVYANWGLDDDMIEMYEQSPDSGSYMMLGTREVFDRIHQLSADAANPDTYAELKELIHMDEYMNYMASKLYTGDWDWPDNNLKGWRKLDGGRYRYVFFDSDAAFSSNDPFSMFDTYQWHTYDYIYDEGGSRYGEIEFATVFLNLLTNEEFRERFIDVMCVVSASVFDYERSCAIVDELVERINPIMAYEGKTASNVGNAVKNGINGRVDALANSMKNYSRFGLNGTDPQTLLLTSTLPSAEIYINDVKVPYSEFNGKVFGPVTLKAIAPGGYKFCGWKGTPKSIELFGMGSEWDYYDKGSLDGESWKLVNYSTTNWSKGAAPLGYSKAGIVTELNYGGDANNKHTTYYFRKQMSFYQTLHSAVLDFVADDGFIVYVNGREAGRYNLPSGEVTYSTLASTANNNPDKGQMVLDASLFRKGVNTIAVEVHNNNLNSSDIMWDASISYVTEADNSYISTDAKYTIGSGVQEINAVFEPLTEAERKEENLAPVVINEVCAANDVFADEYNSRGDWLELYNTTGEDIDVEGMYLTDNVEKPTKYQITKGESSANTILPAGGYMVIWCDKQETDKMLHAPFKIGASGGTMMISAADQSWSSKFDYCAMGGEESAGRYPNGSKDVYLLNVPTIAKANIMNSYAVAVDQPSSGIEQVITNRTDNGGLILRYAAQMLIVRSEQAEKATVTIYDLEGRQLRSGVVTINGGMAEISTEDFGEGCFIARAIDSEGNIATTKFVVKH